jgi:hypothetical protein
LQHHLPQLFERSPDVSPMDAAENNQSEDRYQPKSPEHKIKPQGVFSKLRVVGFPIPLVVQRHSVQSLCDFETQTPDLGKVCILSGRMVCPV